jgi:hypothetical protein
VAAPPGQSRRVTRIPLPQEADWLALVVSLYGGLKDMRISAVLRVIALRRGQSRDFTRLMVHRSTESVPRFFRWRRRTASRTSSSFATTGRSALAQVLERERVGVRLQGEDTIHAMAVQLDVAEQYKVCHARAVSRPSMVTWLGRPAAAFSTFRPCSTRAPSPTTARCDPPRGAWLIHSAVQPVQLTAFLIKSLRAGESTDQFASFLWKVPRLPCPAHVINDFDTSAVEARRHFRPQAQAQRTGSARSPHASSGGVQT